MRSRRSCAKAGQRNPESGYALLLVFAMAAIVAISLYMEVPRAAFEAQRDKEQLLMDRGQQYSRAIALFVRKFQRFPASMDELENTNNMRFLRRRYVDPMTGKADWRILHAGPGGVITDSITAVKKPDATAQQTFITELQMFGTQTAGDSEGVNLATRRRASDQPGAAGDPNGAGAGGGGGAVDPGMAPSTSGPIAGYNGPVMVLSDGRIVPANTSGTEPQNPAPGGGQLAAGQPGALPGTNGTLLGANGSGSNGSPFPGQTPGGGSLPTGVAIQQNSQTGQSSQPPQQQGPPNSAASLINQILTTPRPGGLNGLQGGAGAPGQGTASSGIAVGGPSPLGNTSAAPQQQVIGAGLAGVASKREQEGIKSFNDHTKYNEWEFVYDITKDPMRVGQGATGAAGATGGAQPNRPGAPGQSPQLPATGVGGPTMTSGTTPSQ